MKRIQKYLLSILLGLLIIGCSTYDNEQENINKGELIIKLASNQRMNLAVADFGLQIENLAGEVVLSYEKLSDAPDKINLAIGDYKVKVFSAENKPSFTFDMPYYSGEQTCTIESGKETEVEIICSLQHVKLMVVFDTEITEDAKSYAVILQSTNDEITIDASTSKTVYAERSALVLTTLIEEQDGTRLTNKQVISGLEKMTEYTLNISY